VPIVPLIESDHSQAAAQKPTHGMVVPVADCVDYLQRLARLDVRYSRAIPQLLYLGIRSAGTMLRRCRT
jgi:hypothetical protein